MLMVQVNPAKIWTTFRTEICSCSQRSFMEIGQTRDYWLPFYPDSTRKIVEDQNFVANSQNPVPVPFLRQA